ncbi:MAG: S-layer homology domain-containing protein [Oscillospiraceae bacterium]|jgi:hypothetical protein|nr:S-layer homology domain-containing protein [Oscillospiraceae bacterium]
MKSLRKVLCLALAIVMAMSLIVVAGAAEVKSLADYADKDTISAKYLEAVDVITVLGITKGDENANFGAQNNLTRAESAKLIAYVALGKAAADKLTNRASSFTDVEGISWANPYIEYGVEKGYINGNGDGTFDPDGNVTGTQYVKMLLGAVGYGAKGEFVGPSWELNTIVLGTQYGLYTGVVGVDFSEAAKREEAAQYTLNALYKPYLVSYNALLGEYLYKYDSIFNTGNNNKEEKDWATLGSENFGLGYVETANGLGFEGVNWYKNKTQITGWYQHDVIVDEFAVTAAYASGSSLTKYSWNKRLVTKDAQSNVINDPLAGIDIYDNGLKTAKVDYTDLTGPYSVPFNYLALGPYGLTPTNDLGTYVYLVDSDADGLIDKVIKLHEMLAQVVSASPYGTTYRVWNKANKADGSYDNTAVEPTTYTQSFIPPTGTSYAKDDYIVIVPALYPVGTQVGALPTDLATGDFTKAADYNYNSILKSYKAESITTKLTSVTGSQTSKPLTLTAEGKTYTAVAVWYKLVTSVAQLTWGKDVNLFLNDQGAVIGYNSTVTRAGDLNYLYVRAAKFSDGNAWTAKDAKLSVILATGEALIIDLPISGDGKVFYPQGNPASLTTTATLTDIISGKAPSGTDYWGVKKQDDINAVAGQVEDGVWSDNNAYVDHWFSYVVNDNGTYSLSKLITAEVFEQKDVTVGRPIAGTYSAGPVVAWQTSTKYPSAGTGANGSYYANTKTVLTQAAGGRATVRTGWTNFPDKTFIYGVNVTADIKEPYATLVIVDKDSPTTVTHVYTIAKGVVTAPPTIGIVTNGNPQNTSSDVDHRWYIVRTLVDGVVTDKEILFSNDKTLEAGQIISYYDGVADKIVPKQGVVADTDTPGFLHLEDGTLWAYSTLIGSPVLFYNGAYDAATDVVKGDIVEFYAIAQELDIGGKVGQGVAYAIVLKAHAAAVTGSYPAANAYPYSNTAGRYTTWKDAGGDTTRWYHGDGTTTPIALNQALLRDIFFPTVSGGATKTLTPAAINTAVKALKIPVELRVSVFYNGGYSAIGYNLITDSSNPDIKIVLKPNADGSGTALTDYQTLVPDTHYYATIQYKGVDVTNAVYAGPTSPLAVLDEVWVVPTFTNP